MIVKHFHYNDDDDDDDDGDDNNNNNSKVAGCDLYRELATSWKVRVYTS